MLKLWLAQPAVAFRKIKSWRRSGAVLRQYDSPEMRQMLTHPERFFERHDVTCLKHSKRSTVVRVQLGATPVVVKRTNNPSVWRAARRAVSPSRARRSWHAAALMAKIGVPTAQPLAFVETKWGPLRTGGYLIMEDLDAVDAPEYLLSKTCSPQRRRQIVSAIAEMMRRLHAAGVSHGDNNLRNIMIKGNKPYLIDLDAVRAHGRGSLIKKRYIRRDVQRFIENWKRLAPDIAGLFKRALKGETVYSEVDFNNARSTL